MKTVPIESQQELPTIEEIEKFVLDNGCDHVPTFGGVYEGGIQVQQVADEIAPCIHAILSSQQPITAYLEIGAAAGGTTFLMNYYLKPKQVVLIDNNRHPKHHVRPYILSMVVRKEIIGDSHAGGTVEAIRSLGIGFDVLMIDGDHSYDGVLADYQNYIEFLNPGGFLIFHDSMIEQIGIMRLVKELRHDTALEFTDEYVTKKHTFQCGVALFRKVVA